MADQATFQEQPSTDLFNHVVDMEEKQRLVRDRVILLGQTVVDDRDRLLRSSRI